VQIRHVARWSIRILSVLRGSAYVKKRDVTVVGAGIFGLWQALLLAGTGARVRLVEQSTEPFEASASRWAGAMIAPDCEAEAAPPLVRALGHEGLAHWARVYPDLIRNGSLVVAAPRDRAELTRFARQAPGSVAVDHAALTALEPGLEGRFSAGLFYPDEAHMETPHALAFLLREVRSAGVDVCFGQSWTDDMDIPGLVVDCRGLGARVALPDLRGVRGERLVVRTNGVTLTRPLRLLHPRASFYIVPWRAGQYMIGATILESEDTAAMTLRSALELMGLAYALHPGFGEAEVIELGAGLRPAFPDNVPRVIVRGNRILVNGAYRHGFLLAPVMAAAVSAYLSRGTVRPEFMRVEPG
jgi:glycine oxidase